MPHPTIRFANAAKRFEGSSDHGAKTEATELSLNFGVEAGTLAVLLGPNGGGKTTALKLAAGLTRPDSGSISIEGTPAHKWSRDRLGLMLSIQLLYPTLTVRENLLHSASLYAVPHTRGTVEAAIDFWNLSHIAHRHPKNLSNGQRTLLALARATLHQPDLLLLDEPAAFLDASHRTTLLDFLKSFSGTVLLTTPSLAPYTTLTKKVVIAI